MKEEIKKQKKNKKFPVLNKGDILIVTWKDPTTFQDINEFEIKHPSRYLTPTKNLGFFVTCDKESIMISNMTYGNGKLEKFDNVTIIPKRLIENIEKLKKEKWKSKKRTKQPS